MAAGKVLLAALAFVGLGGVIVATRKAPAAEVPPPPSGAISPTEFGVLPMIHNHTYRVEVRLWGPAGSEQGNGASLFLDSFDPTGNPRLIGLRGTSAPVPFRGVNGTQFSFTLGMNGAAVIPVGVPSIGGFVVTEIGEIGPDGLTIIPGQRLLSPA